MPPTLGTDTSPVTFLSDFESIRTTLACCLQQATHHISYFCWLLDVRAQLTPTATLGDLLEQACARGVQVWILAFDNYVFYPTVPRWTRRTLIRNRTVRKNLHLRYVAPHGPLSPFWQTLAGTFLGAEVLARGPVCKWSYHQKLLVVDHGRHLLLNGTDLSADRSGRMDTLPPVLNPSGYIWFETAAHWTWTDAPMQATLAQWEHANWHHEGRAPWPRPAVGGGGGFHTNVDGAAPRTLLQRIRHARRSVYVENQYFFSHAGTRNPLITALLDALAAQPALHVHVVTNQTFWDTGPALMQWALQVQTFRTVDAIREGLQQRQIDPARLRVSFPRHRAGHYPIFVHSKVWLIDDQWLGVGSSNWADRSWLPAHDVELDMVWNRPDVVDAWRHMHAHLWRDVDLVPWDLLASPTPPEWGAVWQEVGWRTGAQIVDWMQGDDGLL